MTGVVLTADERANEGSWKDTPISPAHYKKHPSGAECIQIAQEFSFNLGNVIKYVWRAGLKSPDALTDLKKARRCLDYEIERLERAKK